MSRPPLRAIVEHEGRLDVMCCLENEGPLGTEQLAAKTGRPRRAIGRYLRLLGTLELVNRVKADGGATVYELTLDDHPDWVREAVENHRRRD